MDSHEIDKLGEEIYDNYKPLFDSDDLCLLSTMRYDPSLSETEPTSASSLNKSNFFLFDEHYHRLKFTVDYFKRQKNFTPLIVRFGMYIRTPNLQCLHR